MANEREVNALRRLVGIEISTTGADSASRAIGSVDDALSNVDKSSRTSAKGLGVFNGGLQKVSNSATKFAAIGYGIKQVFDNLGFSTSQKQLSDYNKEILKSTVQFSKYGESVFQVEKRVLKIKNTFGFTRQEALKLQSTFEKGFNYQSPNKMIGVLETLESIVGANSEAMQEMIQNASAIGQVIPIYQELFNIGMSSQTAKAAVNARKTSKELLYAAALTGRISIGDFKTQLEGIAALENISPAQAKANEARAKQIKNLNELKVIWEDITLKVANYLTPRIEELNNLLQSGGERLKKWAAIALATAAGITAIVAAIGTANAAMAVANFASGTGILGKGGKSGKLGSLGKVGRSLADHGSSPAKPSYVVVLNQRGGGRGGGHVGRGYGRANGSKFSRLARLEGSVRGRAKGNFGRLGRAAHLGSKALRFGGIGTAIAGAGMAANLGVNFAQNSFASPESLNKSGFIGKTAKEGGSLLAGGVSGAAAGALIGSIIPVVGTALGAGIGAGMGTTVALFKSLNQNMYTLSETTIKARNNFEKVAEANISKAETLEQKNLLVAQYKTKELNDQRKDISGSMGGRITGDLFTGKEKKELERINKEIADINATIPKLKKEAKEAFEQYEASEELKKQNVELINVTSKLKLVESYSAAINKQYDASIGKLSSIANIVSATAGRAVGVDGEEALREAQINNQKNIQAAQFRIEQIEKIKNTDFSNISFGAGNDEEAMKQLNKATEGMLTEEQLTKLSHNLSPVEVASMMNSMLDEAKSAKNKALMGRSEISDMIIESGRGAQELAKSNTARIDADIALASNLAAGVSVSAQMRMENVQAIQGEIVAIENMISLAERRLAEANKAAKQAKEDGNEVAYDAAMVDRVKTEQKLNGLIVERTQSMTKQAELTKVMRDGYIDAIAAMTTGAGMFTQITIDQNKNLGQLAAGTNNRVVGVRSGAMGRGFTSSERYSAGGIMSNGSRFGASDEVNKLITESNPLASFNNVADDIGDSVSSAGSQLIQTWQDEAGRFFSNMSAAMRDQKYGTSELQDKVQHFGSGGVVKQVMPGTGDVQPAMLTAGEIVVPSEGARAFQEWKSNRDKNTAPSEGARAFQEWKSKSKGKKDESSKAFSENYERVMGKKPTKSSRVLKKEKEDEQARSDKLWEDIQKKHGTYRDPKETKERFRIASEEAKKQKDRVGGWDWQVKKAKEGIASREEASNTESASSGSSSNSGSGSTMTFSGSERTDLVNALAKEFTELVIKALDRSEIEIMNNFKEIG